MDVRSVTYTTHIHSSTSGVSGSYYQFIQQLGTGGFRIGSAGLSDITPPNYFSTPVVAGKRFAGIKIGNAANANGPIFVCSDITTGSTASATKIGEDITPVLGVALGSLPVSLGFSGQNYFGTQADKAYYLVFATGTDQKARKNNDVAVITFIYK